MSRCFFFAGVSFWPGVRKGRSDLVGYPLPWPRSGIGGRCPLGFPVSKVCNFFIFGAEMAKISRRCTPAENGLEWGGGPGAVVACGKGVFPGLFPPKILEDRVVSWVEEGPHLFTKGRQKSASSKRGLSAGRLGGRIFALVRPGFGHGPGFLRRKNAPNLSRR